MRSECTSITHTYNLFTLLLLKVAFLPNKLEKANIIATSLSYGVTAITEAW